jgi:methyl-accepting chemotaxis protein
MAMNGLGDIKLRYWIVAGYSIPVAILAISTMLILSNVQRSKQAVLNFEQATQLEEKIDVFDLNVELASKAVRGYLIGDSDRPRDNEFDAYLTAKSQYNGLVEDIQTSMSQSERQDDFEQLWDLVQQQEEFHNRLIELVNRGEMEQAVELWQVQTYQQRAETISDLAASLRKQEHTIVRQSKETLNQGLDTLTQMIWAIAILSILLCAIAGWILISRTIRWMRQEASAIASASTEIATTVEQQERVTVEQASSVNQTTSTMEELNASAQQSAEQAEAAAQGVRRVLQLASGEVQSREWHDRANLKYKSEQVARQVTGLSEQLSQIYSITNVVSDLASQTNMLALNAAVEAVRAGEAGKGFGVVAGEIRKLAERSRTSAEKINALVGDIQQSMSATVQATEQGTKAVDEIVGAIDEIAVNVKQISLTANQQASAISQVMEAINNINMGAQQTATGISQTKVGTQNLNQTAQRLETLV